MTMVELAVGDAVAVEKGGSLLRGGVVKKFNDGMQINGEKVSSSGGKRVVNKVF